MNDATPDDLACRELVDMVSDYLDGALPDAQARRVAAHLADCPGCAEYVRQLRSTVRALRALPTEQLDPRITSALLRAFREGAEGAGPV